MKGVTKGEVCVCIVSDRCWLRASPLCLPLHGSHECTHHHDSCQCCYFRFYPLFTGTLLLALLILSIYRSSYLNIIDRAVQLYESCVTVWLPVLRILTRLLSGSDLEVRILTKKMNNFKYNMLDFFLVLWLFMVGSGQSIGSDRDPQHCCLLAFSFWWKLIIIGAGEMII